MSSAPAPAAPAFQAFIDLSPAQRRAAYDWAERTYGGDWHTLAPSQKLTAYDHALTQAGGSS